ncbi:unnamed protein product, partial [Ectocarpus fasciculatus]
LGSSVALLATGIWAVHLNLSHRRAKEAPVLWSWIPIFGSALEFGQRPIEFMIEQSKRTEEMSGILVAGQRMFFIHDTNSYNAIFKADKKKLSFDEFTIEIKEKSFGISKSESVDCSRDNPARALYNKFLLQDQEGAKLTTAMVDRLDKLISALPKEKKVVNFYDFVSRFAFQGSIAALFNEEMADIDGLYESFLRFDAKFGLSVAGIPLSLFPDAVKGREDCVQACAEAVQKAKGLIEARVKLYSTETAGGVPPSTFDDMVRYQVAMMWASVANTMPGAYWTLYFIMLDPAARAAVTSELFEVFGPVDPNTSRVPTTAQLLDLKTLDSCISEALRLMSGSLIMRQVMTNDLELTMSSGKTYKFRKGDRVGIFPTVAHYDENLFENPKDFKYDRFLERSGSDAAGSSKANTCFLPFGAGATYCPGRKFARSEIKTIVYYLLRYFDTEFVDIEDARKSSRSYEPSRAGLGIFPPLN